MQVAFHLRRRPTAAPASALLLLSRQTADLVRLYIRLGWDPLPPVYLVADGFLLTLPRPTSEAFGGVVRLRMLAENLLLPVDADLLPALLLDEAAGLARRRGLVFLPGGRVLEFEPTQPLPLSAMIGMGQLRRGTWDPLPEPAPLADRLTEITLDRPEVFLDELPPPMQPEDDAPAPQEANLPKRTLGRATFGAGKALAWLGKTLGIKGLAAAGMSWMGAGLGWAPNLAESVLGRQEASLRDLLRAFREGDVERALRRALPIGELGRGSTPSTVVNLPFHDLRYSLRNILGGSSGPSSIWFTEADLQEELVREYRRQAELAAQRGDYRRAAFIYGKLLHDYRAAAAVLSRGGLHRDAATLYLKRLDDPLAAAREFEAAGEVDRALELYRRRGEHLLAGDLLRRAGDEEEALKEYGCAAEQMARSGRGYYEAGELLRTRAGRGDLALPYYETGWAQRPVGSPVPCAIRLAQAFAQNGSGRKLGALANAAAEYLAPPGNDAPAADFYNELARLAERFPREDVRDDLRDRALTGIAGKLRQQVAAGTVRGGQVPAMQREPRLWPSAVVSDAQFALRLAAKETRPHSAPGCTRVTIPARVARVTAVCQAADSGDVFIAFESGEVVNLKPPSLEIGTVTDEGIPIHALAATQAGDGVALMTSAGHAYTSLKYLIRQQSYRAVGEHTFINQTIAPDLSQNIAGYGQRPVIGLRTGMLIRIFQGPNLTSVDHELSNDNSSPGNLLLLPAMDQTSTGVSLLAICDHEFVYWVAPCAKHSPQIISAGGWVPGRPGGKWLSRPVLTYLNKGAEGIELAGIDGEGHVYFSEVRFDGGNLRVVTKALSSDSPYLAAAILRPGVIAAVTREAVHWWLRRESKGFLLLGETSVSLPSAVACFRHQTNKELIVVCAEGTVVVVPAKA